MPEFKVLPLDKIVVPENRLRQVDENKAFLVGQSIATGGLIHPVTVYPTPRAARPYTLAAGATRYRGHEIHGLKEIAVLIRKMDKNGARRVEIEENLFRDELSKLDRAMHVVEYRRLWEEERGAIRPGGDKRSEDYHSANLAEWSGENAQAHFFEQALDDLGLSRRAIERAQFIGGRLQPELRELIAKTPLANNQSELEKLAKLEPQRQREVAAAYRDTRDMKKALDITAPNAKAQAAKSAQDEILERLVATWDRADEKTRAAFLKHVGARTRQPREKLPTPAELMAEAASASDEVQ